MILSESHMTDGCGKPQGSMTKKADRLGKQPGSSALFAVIRKGGTFRYRRFVPDHSLKTWQSR